MAELTKEQERSLAIARARRRKAQAEAQENARGMSPGQSIGDAMLSGASGMAEGAAGLLDFPAQLPGLLASGGSWLGEKAGLIDPAAAQNFRGAISEFSSQGGVSPMVPKYDPQTTAGEYMRTVGNFLPGMALGGTAPQMVAAGLASEFGGQMAEGTDYEVPARIGGGILGGYAGAGLEGAVARGAAKRNYVKGAETSAQLSERAKELYQAGHSRGIKIKPSTTKAFNAEMRKIASAEGYITPSGAIAENSNLRQVFKLLDDYESGPVTTKQMQAVRRQISELAGSPKPGESRLGVMLKNKYDDYLSQFAPEFKEANAINARAMRGEMMDRAEELAEVRASQFSQSGTENALRTEFRQMDRAITKGKTKGLRPDQIEAVQRVSRGTPASNALRTVGKLAPRGPVSFSQHAIPFAAGTYIGGLQLGAAMAGTTAGTGIIAQLLATGMQRRAAQQASAAMRQPAPMALPPYRANPQGLLPGLSMQGNR